MFVTEVHPRGYGYRAPTRSRLTAARSPDGERARRQEGPRWRRLRFLLRRGSLSLVCGALLRERDARERRGERNEARVQREAGRGAVLIRRNGRTAVGFDPTAWNDRATQRPRRDATFPAQAQVAAWARVRAARAAAGPDKRSGFRAKQASGPNEQEGEFSVYYFILIFRSIFE